MRRGQPMSMGRILLILSLFFIILFVFRVGWLMYYETPEHPLAKEGIIDLTDWKFTDDQTITLDGEWEFYLGSDPSILQPVKRLFRIK